MFYVGYHEEKQAIDKYDYFVPNSLERRRPLFSGSKEVFVRIIYVTLLKLDW